MNITFRKFEQAMRPYGCFSLSEARTHFPEISPGRFSDWQRQGWLVQVARGFYMFPGLEGEPGMLWWLANRLYRPSYISLQSAMWHYGFIPEGVFTTTSITTRKTRLHPYREWTFSYRTLARHLYFGYRIEAIGQRNLLVAEPEKALLDFFYLEPGYNTPEKVAGLRLDAMAIQQQVSWERMAEYASAYRSPALENRMALVKQTVHA